MIATTRAGPRNAPARASRTEESTPPENATPSRSTTCSCERTRSTRAWSTPNAVSSGTVLLSLAYSDGSSDHSAWKALHGPRDGWCGRPRVPHSLYPGGWQAVRGSLARREPSLRTSTALEVQSTGDDHGGRAAVVRLSTAGAAVQASTGERTVSARISGSSHAAAEGPAP